jgi:hypothetical protein
MIFEKLNIFNLISIDLLKKKKDLKLISVSNQSDLKHISISGIALRRILLIKF